MPNIDTIIALENGELEFNDAVDFFQEGIDAGWIWNLQGSYGRTARQFIEQGYCTAA